MSGMECFTSPCGGCKVTQLPLSAREGVAATVALATTNHTLGEIGSAVPNTLIRWVDEAESTTNGGFIVDKPTELSAALGALRYIAQGNCESRS